MYNCEADYVSIWAYESKYLLLIYIWSERKSNGNIAGADIGKTMQYLTCLLQAERRFQLELREEISRDAYQT